jgi:hypothetical protein
MARQKHDLVVLDPAKRQRAGRLPIRRSHDFSMRYFKAGELGHACAANDCKHISGKWIRD